MNRIRAICCCLFYGLSPWQLYEEECHYRPWGYWRHLRENLAYGVRWLLFVETDEDREFESSVNANDPPIAGAGRRACGT